MKTYLNSHTAMSPGLLSGSAFLLGQLCGGGGALALSPGSPAALKANTDRPHAVMH